MEGERGTDGQMIIIFALIISASSLLDCYRLLVKVVLYTVKIVSMLPMP